MTTEARWGSKLSLVADSTLVTVYERNRCKTNGLSHVSHDKTIEKNLVRLKEGIQQLEAELSAAEESGSVPSSELQAREDTLIKIQDQLVKLEALFDDTQDATARDVLLGLNQPSRRPDSSSREVRFSDNVVDTDNMDNGQMLQLQQRIVDDQDRNLDRLSEALGRQQEIGLMIGDELDTHLDLLDDTSNIVDRTESRLTNARKRLAKVAKGSKGCGPWGTILILIIVLIIVLKI